MIFLASFAFLVITGLCIWIGLLQSHIKHTLAKQPTVPIADIKPPVTAADIVERKKKKHQAFGLKPSRAKVIAQAEAKLNTKEQRHQRLVEEIGNVGLPDSE